MTLRKCPSCKEIVGAESEICARCGVNFKAAQIRRVVILALSALVALLVLVRVVFRGG